MEDVGKDDRFASIGKDPIFRRMKSSDRKVKIDKRFDKMFSDKQFKLKYTVDARGRPVNRTTNENLRKFYDLSESENEISSSSDEEDTKETTKLKKKKATAKKKKTEDKNVKGGKKQKDVTPVETSDVSITEAESGDSKKKKNTNSDSSKKTKDSLDSVIREDSEVDSDKEEESDAATDEDDNEEESSGSDESDSETKPSGISGDIDLARGEGNIVSSDDEGDFDFQDDEFDHNWGELTQKAPEAEEITHRLAICNMDWDRIKVRDILVLLSSFSPTGGIVKKVTVSIMIYPSEFGLQRMQEDDVNGPVELVEKKKQSKGKPFNGNEDSIEGEQYHREKLRLYQINRLKYYYAVAECDSAETASGIYEQCDGIEYESSATRMDLRFIPNDMEFDQKPHSVASDMPDVSTYKPSQFFNSALQQCKVNLTWDETDPDRVKLTNKNFKKEDIDAMDVNDYLASSSSEDEEDPYGNFIEQPTNFANVSDGDSDEDGASKYKKLLGNLDTETHKNDDGLEMEISWQPGIKETTEKMVKKSKAKESVFDNYLEKKKEKKRVRKAKSKQESDEEDEGGMVDAFSDDELPDDVDSDNEDAPVKKKNKKKRKLEEESLSVEEQAEKERKEAELALLLMDEDDGKQHFSLRSIQEAEAPSKKKKRKMKSMKKKKVEEKIDIQDDFKINLQDSRFKDVFDNPMYNIDPTAPEFKKTKAMGDLIQEKLKYSEKKGKNKEKSLLEDIKSRNNNASEPKTVSDGGLSGLIKSVKAKTLTLQNKKKHKNK